MQGKIALEEHFAIPETLHDSRGFLPDDDWSELSARLLDIHDRRLREMDEHGIEMMILSLNAPAVQAIPDSKRADEIARRANDFLAEQVAKRPDRFQGFAALPMQDPELATRELSAASRSSASRARWSTASRRSATPTTVVYYDRRSTGRSGRRSSGSTCRSTCIRAIRCRAMRRSTTATVAAGADLGVRPGDRRACAALDGQRAVRRHPRLQDHPRPHGRGPALQHLARRPPQRLGQGSATGYPAKRKIGDYFQANFYLTTSGNFRTQTLIDAMLEIGADQILFSADWPFENIDHAAQWFDARPSARPTASRSGGRTR